MYSKSFVRVGIQSCIDVNLVVDILSVNNWVAFGIESMHKMWKCQKLTFGIMGLSKIWVGTTGTLFLERMKSSDM